MVASKATRSSVQLQVVIAIVEVARDSLPLPLVVDNPVFVASSFDPSQQDLVQPKMQKFHL